MLAGRQNDQIDDLRKIERVTGMTRINHTYICNRDGLDNGGQEVDHDDESHGETAEATEPVKEYQLAQVVYCGVDPATTLRK